MSRHEEEDMAFRAEMLLFISKRDMLNLTDSDSIALVGIAISPSADDRLVPKRIIYATPLRGIKHWDSDAARTAVKETAMAALSAHSCSFLEVRCTNACRGDDGHGPHCNATGRIRACPEPALWAHVEVMFVGPDFWMQSEVLASADRLAGAVSTLGAEATPDGIIEELSRAMGKSILGGGQSPHED